MKIPDKIIKTEMSTESGFIGKDGKSLDLKHLKYKTGIPTLRSSSHRVRYSAEKAKRNKNAPIPKCTSSKCNNRITLLPMSLRKVTHVPYDTCKYNLKHEIAKLLQSLDSTIVGKFGCHIHEGGSKSVTNACEDVVEGADDSMTESLENFEVPPISLMRKKQKGKCEDAQEYLSQALASSTEFLQTFDSLVIEVILPHLKSRLVQEGIIDGEKSIAMYCQRPPTLRLQPGPARASVKAHRDSDYGHQPGELNYWIPLTDRHLTGVDLYAESDENIGDYEPLLSDYGFASSFHGSNCRHYVNTNSSRYTRVSLDFRVGIEPFYDPEWQMIGTRDDHCRHKILI